MNHGWINPVLKPNISVLAVFSTLCSNASTCDGKSGNPALNLANTAQDMVRAEIDVRTFAACLCAFPTGIACVRAKHTC